MSVMHQTIGVFAVVILLSAASGSQTSAPSLPLGSGRPDRPGITRTTLQDDAKSTVTRVHFAPGAMEPPHTHRYDVILVPDVDGMIDLGVEGRKTVTSVKSGDVQFVPKNTVHRLTNRGKAAFELIAIAVK